MMDKEIEDPYVLLWTLYLEKSMFDLLIIAGQLGARSAPLSKENCNVVYSPSIIFHFQFDDLMIWLLIKD